MTSEEKADRRFAKPLEQLPREEVRRQIAHLRLQDPSANCASIARLIADDDLRR